MEEGKDSFAQFAHYKNAVKFLERLCENGNITLSCKLSGLKRRDAYRLRDTDEEFKKAWGEAEKLGVDAMEDEAVRRATDGIDKPIYYKGHLVDTVKEYSDTLLIFLLKGKKPEVYKERVEQSGTVTIKSVKELSDDELAKIVLGDKQS